uniref:Secreted protein n=1 Tax=Rhizophora mucronata TaxID=61149 RepID=A0A2P2N426_RHIMU
MCGGSQGSFFFWLILCQVLTICFKSSCICCFFDNDNLFIHQKKGKKNIVEYFLYGFYKTSLGVLIHCH